MMKKSAEYEHTGSKRRFELRMKADQALALIPVDIMNGGGMASFKRISEVIDQILSEGDVLESENEALHRNHGSITETIESFQEQYRRERTWRGDETKECSKCGQEFGFWRPLQYCRSCAGIYCDSCCNSYVQFEKLTELHPPSTGRKCSSCVEIHKQRIIQ